MRDSTTWKNFPFPDAQNPLWWHSWHFGQCLVCTIPEYTGGIIFWHLLHSRHDKDDKVLEVEIERSSVWSNLELEAPTCAGRLDISFFPPHLTLWRNSFQFWPEDRLVGFITPPAPLDFRLIGSQAICCRLFSANLKKCNSLQFLGLLVMQYINTSQTKLSFHLPSIMAWGKHCESLGRLREACDPQFSSGHFRSFHLIVVLPKLFVHFICRLWFSSVGFDCRASDASLPNFLTPMLKMWLSTWFWCVAGVSRWIDGNLSETELRVKRKGLVAILLDAPLSQISSLIVTIPFLLAARINWSWPDRERCL